MATAEAQYRICPRTGLQFHKSAETLIKLNAVAAVVALLIGGVVVTESVFAIPGIGRLTVDAGQAGTPNWVRARMTSAGATT